MRTPTGDKNDARVRARGGGQTEGKAKENDDENKRLRRRGMIMREVEGWRGDKRRRGIES